MSLAFEHKRSFEIKEFDWEEVSQRVLKELNNRKTECQQSDSGFRFKLYSSVFRIPFPVLIYFENIGTETYLHYGIDLSKLVRIIVYVTMVCSVLSVRSIQLYLVTAGLLSITIYFLNLFEISGRTNTLISKIVKKQELVSENSEEMSQEQMKWMTDHQRCPACGSHLSIFDFDCPDCDLKIRSIKELPVSHTNRKTPKIKYYFKKSS